MVADDRNFHCTECECRKAFNKKTIDKWLLTNGKNERLLFRLVLNCT